MFDLKEDVCEVSDSSIYFQRNDINRVYRAQCPFRQEAQGFEHRFIKQCTSLTIPEGVTVSRPNELLCIARGEPHTTSLKNAVGCHDSLPQRAVQYKVGLHVEETVASHHVKKSSLLVMIERDEHTV